MNAGEAPIGCVLARGDGTVIARGYNELNRTQDKTAHAEMVTFRPRRRESPDRRPRPDPRLDARAVRDVHWARRWRRRWTRSSTA